MEITRDNYEQMEPIIIEQIHNAEFISLDLEMTGINPWNNNIIDFPEHRYNKYKSTAEKYRIIQLGLCLWNKSTSCETNYIARPYNIYLFPEDFSGNNFLNCETGAIIFNREHKMDFNKWIYKGIPYLNAKQESTVLESLTDSNINFYNPNDKLKYKNISLYKDEDKVKYDDFCRQFSEFYASEDTSYFFEKQPKFMVYYFLNNTPEHIRKQLYFSYETLEGKPLLMISKLSEEEKKTKLDIEIGDKLRDLSKKKGVRNIFEALTKKKSIFVGHNCNLDLMFTIAHLGDPLPNSLKEFKEQLRSYFTSIYDTKFVFESFCGLMKEELGIEFKNSHLETVYTTLKALYKDTVEISLHEDMKHTYPEHSGVFHEAAFDAYVTGSAFVWMGSVLKEKLSAMHNKLFLMKSIYSSFNLNGDEAYVLPDVMPYCLKAIKQINDISLQDILQQDHFKRIKKFYHLESQNSLLILVHLESAQLMNDFEQIMATFPNLFQFFHFYKFKQMLKEEEDKKFDKKKQNNNK